MILGLSSADGGRLDCENCRHLMVVGLHDTDLRLHDTNSCITRSARTESRHEMCKDRNR